MKTIKYLTLVTLLVAGVRSDAKAERPLISFRNVAAGTALVGLSVRAATAPFSSETVVPLAPLAACALCAGGIAAAVNYFKRPSTKDSSEKPTSAGSSKASRALAIAAGCAPIIFSDSEAGALARAALVRVYEPVMSAGSYVGSCVLEGLISGRG